MTYNVFGGTLNLAVSIYLSIYDGKLSVGMSTPEKCIWSCCDVEL